MWNRNRLLRYIHERFEHWAQSQRLALAHLRAVSITLCVQCRNIAFVLHFPNINWMCCNCAHQSMSWIDCVIATAYIPIKIIHRLEQNAAFVCHWRWNDKRHYLTKRTDDDDDLFDDNDDSSAKMCDAVCALCTILYTCVWIHWTSARLAATQTIISCDMIAYSILFQAICCLWSLSLCRSPCLSVCVCLYLVSTKQHQLIVNAAK